MADITKLRMDPLRMELSKLVQNAAPSQRTYLHMYSGLGYKLTKGTVLTT